MRALLFAIAVCIGAVAGEQAPPSQTKPLMRDFMGLCGHTVLFKPERYAGVCRLVRDYHPLEWDVGDDTAYTPAFPLARNKVDWLAVYGSWVKAGLEADVCLMFETIPAGKWQAPADNARAYGESFARFFGPSSAQKLVTSVEIGNEPGGFDDAQYRLMFENMARGLRKGDPKLKIVTCALTTGQSGKYAKSVECLRGADELYDVLNLHDYAQAEGWPTWRRSYPEDPAIEFLKEIRGLLAWRDAHAPGKPVWITEFGWDASTKTPSRQDEFAKWVGVTDLQQAQYLVRAFLCFAALDLERAYIFFFDDKDEPKVHSAAGLTRNGQPKPSWYAVAHLYRTLGACRFKRVVQERAGESYVYEFSHETDPALAIWAVWSPTGSGQKHALRLPLEGRQFIRAEAMPVAEHPTPAPAITEQDGALSLECGESPIYIWLKQVRSR